MVLARLLLRFVPVGVGALAMTAGAALLIVNLVLPALRTPPVKLFPALSGVTWPEKPHLSVKSLLDGSYQAEYGRLIGTRDPFYPGAVRLRTQVEHSFFGTAAIPALIEGPHNSLVEVDYLLDYCARNLAAFRPQARARAAHIREIQDIEERRGRSFLYVLTPSKAAEYPDVIPAGYSCPSTPADRSGFVPVWLEALRQAGVHVVDTTSVIAAARGKYPFRMYPRGGAHWNEVGAALAMQAVMAGLHAIDPDGGFQPFSFTWSMRKHPAGLDVDIAKLLNMIWPYPADPVPVVALQPSPPPVPCPTTKVTIVGGSFAHAILEYIGRTTCLKGASEYEYWHRFRVTWAGDHLDATPEPPESERTADLLGANVLILEENEQVLQEPQHGEALWEFMRANAGS